MTSNDFTLSLELAKRTVALVLAGGRGSRLMQLTDHRVKPAVYFGGKFRIIDFALSNCLNSGIRRIGVVTQYKSHSLLRHLQRGWSFLKPQMNEFVDLLPAQQRIDEESWYRGTADAVYQNEDIVKSYRAKYVVILAGDHVYKMDYSVMLADHVASGAECTVGCIEVLHEEASGFGVMAVDASGRITDFVEKPLQPPTMPGRTEVSLASMGIYVFNADYLFRELACDLADENSEHDFGRNIIPRAVQQGKARAHHFRHSCVGLCNEAYWRDVGTVDAYWDANIDLTAAEPRLDLYDQHWPILTYQPQRPPARFVGVGSATESLVSGGCIVAGRVRQSLVSSSVQIQSSAQVNHSVLLPYVELGRGVRVSHAVVDRGCVIPDGMVIGEDPAEDARRFHRTERGIVLVTREMLART